MNRTLLCIVDGQWLDGDTGEVVDPLIVLEQHDGGVICGYQLYGLLCKLSPLLKLQGNWKLQLPGRRTKDQRMLSLYFQLLSRRFPTEQENPLVVNGRIPSGRGRHRCRRPPAIKWIIWNFELFHNRPTDDVIGAGLRLRKLCEDRGVKPMPTLGGMGRAMLKSSPEWEQGRYFAAPWISEIAREHLPGNHYALRNGFQRDKSILLIDQQSAHHSIVNSIPCPHPRSVHRRGGRIPGRDRKWLSAEDLHLLRRHMGLLHITVEVDTVPDEHLHLYPRWAQVRGRQGAWVWTPELRLLDRRTRLVGIKSALTGTKLDTALLEYSDFALEQLSIDRHPVIKPVLHSAYGSLAANKYGEFEQIILGDTGNYKNPEKVKLPWTDEIAHAVTIKGMSIPTVQNVIAYGVITAEQTTRSLELAREYEWKHGLQVAQVYADALLVRTQRVPFTPPGWEVKADLGEVVAGLPNQIISTRLQRIPGLSGERRRAAYVHQVKQRSVV